MSNISRYIDNQRTYFAKKKAQPLIGFTNSQGKPASWNDIAVKFTYTNSSFINIYFCNLNYKQPKMGTPFTEDDRLAPETHDMLFSYALDIIKENTSTSNKRNKISSARQFLGLLEESINSATLEKIQHAIDSMRQVNTLSSFFDWLYRNKMLPKSCQPNIYIKTNSIRSKTGDDALEWEQNKLPSKNALLAIGAIFYDVIPPYQGGDKDKIEAWWPLLSSTQVQLDSFICTMIALGMASPNRIGAEQVLLTLQRVKRHTQVTNGQQKTVHYLNWRGSKGYKDYQNHINAEMVDSLDRALHYTTLATEPARALARFYRKPNIPLKEVLGEFKPSDDNITLLKPSMNQSTNLLHLGLLLGFFDGTDKCLRVTPNTKGSIDKSKNQFPRFIKPIAQIEVFDTLVIRSHCPYFRVLTGTKTSTQDSIKKYLAGKTELTVAEYQNHTIEINKSQLTGYNRTQNKSVDFEYALFAYTHKQLGGQVTHPFLLVPIGTLSTLFLADLNKHNKSRATIFDRHGFASDFFLKPQQLRHWQNDYLAKKGLPHHLITMLSGRKSAEQTLTYIHTTDAQNAHVIGDISYSNEPESDIKKKVNLRIQTMNQFNEAINNETPTFIHETGFCTQNLALSPCTYMSDFETQCALCSSSCHVAHDSKAIDLLQKDLKVQTYRLEEIQKAINFKGSEGMQKWYKIHYQNTYMLKNLIEVLSDETIKVGNSVRLLTNSNRIKITNLDTKTVEEKRLALPDAEEVLQAAIEEKNDKSKDEATNNFLSFLVTL